MHGTAAPGGEAVAVDPDHVDVARALGDAFAENARAFVDHRVEHPFDDLVLADRRLQLRRAAPAPPRSAPRPRGRARPCASPMNSDRSRGRSSGRTGPARREGRRSARAILAPCACASRCRGRRDRPPRTVPWESRTPSSPRRRPAAARRRAAGARPRCRARDACGCRRSRGTRRPPTGILPILRPTAIAVASASGDVAAPRTTSRRRMMCAGLKKCMPTTASGRDVPRASASTSR